MPYIDKEAKLRLGNPSSQPSPTTAGELTYVIWRTVLGYVRDNGTRYQTFCDILGALTAVRMEFYRRKVAPYEDGKIAENGDVGAWD